MFEIDLENPYPGDIFTEPTKKEWRQVQKLFKNAGLVQDKFFGAFGRKVWNNCLDKVKKNHLILNLEDDIDLDYFGDNFFGDEFDVNQKLKVSDVADALAKAVLKAKGREK